MEQKKLLLVVISVGVFLVLVIGAGMLVFAPKAKPAVASLPPAARQSLPADQPASVDPSEWLKNPSSVSTLQQPAPGSSTRGDVIVIYGERPSVVNGVDAAVGQGVPPAGTATAADGTVVVDVAPQATPQATIVVGPQTAPPPAPRAEPKPTTPEPKTEKAPKAAPAEKPAAKAAPAPAKRSAEEFWVQTGSFSDKGRADVAKETLSSKGIASLVETKDVSGKTYYRVRVGPYTSKNEADYWLSLVKTIEGFDASYVSQVKAKR